MKDKRTIKKALLCPVELEWRYIEGEDMISENSVGVKHHLRLFVLANSEKYVIIDQKNGNKQDSNKKIKVMFLPHYYANYDYIIATLLRLRNNDIVKDYKSKMPNKQFINYIAREIELSDDAEIINLVKFPKYNSLVLFNSWGPTIALYLLFRKFKI